MPSKSKPIGYSNKSSYFSRLLYRSLQQLLRWHLLLLTRQRDLHPQVAPEAISLEWMQTHLVGRKRRHTDLRNGLEEIHFIPFHAISCHFMSFLIPGALDSVHSLPHPSS